MHKQLNNYLIGDNILTSWFYFILYEIIHFQTKIVK